MSLQVVDTIKKSFEAVKGKRLFIITVYVAMIIVTMIINGMTAALMSGRGAVAGIVSIVVQLAVTGVSLGFMKILLNMVDQKPYNKEQLISQFGKLFNMILVSIIVGILATIGFICLIIPGIYIGTRLSMAVFLIVDKDCGIIDSIKQSWSITKGNVLKLLGLGLLLGLINMAGAMVLLVGLIYTIPPSFLAGVMAYRYLEQSAAKQS